MILLNQQILTFCPLECQSYRQIAKGGCIRWKLICLYQTRFVVLNVSGLVTVKIHVEVAKLELDVKRGTAANAAKRISRMITCHHESNDLSGKMKKKLKVRTEKVTYQEA